VTVWAGFSSDLVKDFCVIMNFKIYYDASIPSITKDPASCYISRECKQEADIFMATL
jgi:hypothetical protein